MIWSLTREQVRSQRPYLVWSVVLIALAVGFASYAALITNAARAADAALVHAVGADAEWSGYTEVALTDEAGSVDVSWDELTAIIDAAAADGSRVIASTSIAPVEGGGGFLTTMRGPVDWDALLLEGRPPRPGEIAVAAAYAREHGLSVGDTVDVSRRGQAGASTPLTVAALTRATPDAGGVVSKLALSEPIVAWEDVPALWAAFDGGTGVEWPSTAFVSLNWDGSVPAIEQVAEQVSPGYTGVDEPVTTVSWAALGLAAVVLGVIAMAFAVGRAQAQARSTWVATARALGATRRQVVLSTLMEALVVGALAGLAGYVLGAVAATVHLQVIHSVIAGAAIAQAVTLVPWVLAGALGLGLLLAAIVAGVPAFWAARVQPAAALKPETDITTAEASRRVPFWPLAVGWGAAGAVLVLVSLTGPGVEPSVAAVASLVLFLALTPVIANETLRWVLPPVGRWLSRRPEPTAMVAGDSISARPRQLTVPGFVLALAVGVLVVIGSAEVLGLYTAHVRSYNDDPMAEEVIPTLPAWALPAAVGLVVVAIVIGVAISLITHTVTREERATREALGITHAQTRSAAGLAHGVAVGLGAVVGWGIGAVVATVLAVAELYPPEDGVTIDVSWLAAVGFSASLGLLLIALVGATVGGIVVGLSARSRAHAGAAA